VRKANDGDDSEGGDLQMVIPRNPSSAFTPKRVREMGELFQRTVCPESAQTLISEFVLNREDLGSSVVPGNCYCSSALIAVYGFFCFPESPLFN